MFGSPKTRTLKGAATKTVPPRKPSGYRNGSRTLQGAIPTPALETKKVHQVCDLFHLGEPGGPQRGSQWLPKATPPCRIALIRMGRREGGANAGGAGAAV